MTTTAPARDVAAEILALIDENLIGALGMASLVLPEPSDRVETCGVEILKFRLRRARAAVADLAEYSGRDGKAASAESRPVQPPVAAGECLAPGSGAAISGAVTESDGAVVAPIAGALPPAGRPPLPGGDFLLPRDVRAE